MQKVSFQCFKLIITRIVDGKNGKHTFVTLTMLENMLCAPPQSLTFSLTHKNVVAGGESPERAPQLSQTGALLLHLINSDHPTPDLSTLVQSFQSGGPQALAEGLEGRRKIVPVDSDPQETLLEPVQEPSGSAIATTLQELKNLGLEELQALQQAIDARMRCLSTASAAPAPESEPADAVEEPQGEPEDEPDAVPGPSWDLQAPPVDSINQLLPGVAI